MPIRKFRRRTSSKRRPLSQAQAKAVSSLVKKGVKKMSEWKFLTTYAYGGIDNAGSIVSLSDVAQGDTDNTRNGDSLFASSLGMRYHWVGADAYNTMRLIIFQWNQDDVPSVGDILLDVGVVSSCTENYNTDQASHYKIMYDHTITATQAVTGQGYSGPFMAKKLRVPRSKIQFNGGGTVGTGKIYYLALSDSAAASHPSLLFTSRLNYRDG